jgi:hypothetical protein
LRRNQRFQQQWFLYRSNRCLGFWIHAGLSQFVLPRGSPHNLAATAKRNDTLANWLIGIFVGQTIESYRVVHFGHHQHHGTPMDTEHSYFDPLNFRFIVAALFGDARFQVARERAGVASKMRVSSVPAESPFSEVWPSTAL